MAGSSSSTSSHAIDSPGVGYMLGMPMLLINMGGEMLYILAQRLEAQSINKDKSKRVLNDVVCAMFAPKFMDELMKPQDVYTDRATRQVFDKLAHSSIMRLNPTSMDKLYDLMTMGFKQQIMSCMNPDELVDITLTHIATLRELVEGMEAAHLLDSARDRVTRTYRQLKPAEFVRLRRVLLNFFQDRRVKVSLFLQDKVQNLDGTMVLSRKSPLPKGTVVPGRVV